MSTNFFLFTPETVTDGIGVIQDVHHNAFFGNWPHADLNLPAFGDEVKLSQDFLVMELRNAVMILRRACHRDENGGKPPYMAMETRQILSKNHYLPAEVFDDYIKRMADAIVRAGEILHSPWVEGEIVEMTALADQYHVSEPRWKERKREDIVSLIAGLLKFSQGKSDSSANVRFSNQTGLTISVVARANQSMGHGLDLRQWALKQGFLVRNVRNSKCQEVALMVRVGFMEL